MCEWIVVQSWGCHQGPTFVRSLMAKNSNVVGFDGQLEVNLLNGRVRVLVVQFCTLRCSHGIVVTVFFEFYKT